MSRITQKGATGPVALTANGTFQTAVDANLETLLGSRWDLSDGREVILASLDSSGATNVLPGKLYQDAAIVPNHQNMAVTAITTYSANGNVPYKLTVTLGNTAATANQYRGGFAVINAGTGLGQTLRIASHPAADASASLVVTFEDAPNTALSTSDSKVCLIPPHGANVVVYPTTPTGAAVGVGLYAINTNSAGDNYGFLVSKGLTSCLAQGALTVGANIYPSSAIAGAVASNSTTTFTYLATVGYANQAGSDAEYRCVFIDV